MIKVPVCKLNFKSLTFSPTFSSAYCNNKLNYDHSFLLNEFQVIPISVSNFIDVKNILQEDAVVKMSGDHFSDAFIKELLTSSITIHNSEKKWTTFIAGISSDSDLSESIIGVVILYQHQGVHATLGFSLKSDFWGRGITIAATKKVIAYSSTNLGLNKIITSTLKANSAANKVMQKLGFELINKNIKVDAQNNFYELIMKINITNK